ncbi:leucine--tRNA ligase, partial [Anaerolineae bacterium CFX7]|nr:leucine--tRNA ligase [Anaerolineae bacterium CFX7]
VKAKDSARYPEAVWAEALNTLLLMLAPIAPFMAEEIWARLQRTYSIHQQKWPPYDADAAKEELFTLIVQVNGKVRGKIELPVDVSEDEAKQKAFDDANVKKWVEGKKIERVLYVPERLLNVVVK